MMPNSSSSVEPAVRHDESLSEAERERLGAHYTPRAWASRVVARALQPLLSPASVRCRRCTPSQTLLDLLVIDPACGDGIFLDAAADLLGALVYQAYQVEGEDVSLAEARAAVERNCLLGVDLDPGAIAAARERLGDEVELVHTDALLDWHFDTDGRSTAFVGNPPYLGGRRISTVLGAEYQRKLRAYPYSNGGADLCSYFLMLASGTLAEGNSKGTIGMVCTNTISQGDTREACLKPLLEDHGYLIYAADRNVRWPGAAKVVCSIVHLADKRLAWALWPEQMLERAADFPWAWLGDPVPTTRLVQLEPLRRAPARTPAVQGVLFG